MPEPDPEFIAKHTTEVKLRDGTRVLIRPLVPDDREQLEKAFEQLSLKSRYLRFMSPIDHLSDSMLTYLTDLDYDDHFAWAAAAVDEPGEPGIGVARYVRIKGEPEVAEPAVTVVDEYQGRGLGTILLYALAESAIDHGIKHFRAYVLPENQTMIGALRALGAVATAREPRMLVLEVELPLPQTLTDSKLYRALGAVARGDIEVENPWKRWFPPRSEGSGDS